MNIIYSINDKINSIVWGLYMSRREAIRSAKRIVVGGVATIIALKGAFELTKIAVDKIDEAYWAERPFHDSGEIMTLEWGET